MRGFTQGYALSLDVKVPQDACLDPLLLQSGSVICLVSYRFLIDSQLGPQEEPAEVSSLTADGGFKPAVELDM